MLNDEIENKNQLKKNLKKLLGWTYQTHYLGNKIEITLYKAN
jgi:hypothetical protein